MGLACSAPSTNGSSLIDYHLMISNCLPCEMKMERVIVQLQCIDILVAISEDYTIVLKVYNYYGISRNIALYLWVIICGYNLNY